jgi:hypothetical protein
MGLAGSGSQEFDKTVAETVSRARRALAEVPLMVLVPATLLLTLLTLPLGLPLPLLVWLARHSWRYEDELTQLYGSDNPETDDIDH